MSDYLKKYLKYKNKYLKYKQFGSGVNNPVQKNVLLPSAPGDSLPNLDVRHKFKNEDDENTTILKYVKKFILISVPNSEIGYRNILNFYNNEYTNEDLLKTQEIKLLLSSGDYFKVHELDSSEHSSEQSNIEFYKDYNIHTCYPEFINNGHPFYTYKDGIFTEHPFHELDDIRKNNFIFFIYDLIQNIKFLLQYNKININKKYLLFVNLLNPIHLDNFVRLFKQKCDYISSLEYRLFNRYLVITIISLLKHNGIIDAKGLLLEFIKDNMSSFVQLSPDRFKKL